MEARVLLWLPQTLVIWNLPEEQWLHRKQVTFYILKQNQGREYQCIQHWSPSCIAGQYGQFMALHCIFLLTQWIKLSQMLSISGTNAKGLCNVGDTMLLHLELSAEETGCRLCLLPLKDSTRKVMFTSPIQPCSKEGPFHPASPARGDPLPQGSPPNPTPHVTQAWPTKHPQCGGKYTYEMPCHAMQHTQINRHLLNLNLGQLKILRDSKVVTKEFQISIKLHFLGTNPSKQQI